MYLSLAAAAVIVNSSSDFSAKNPVVMKEFDEHNNLCVKRHVLLICPWIYIKHKQLEILVAESTYFIVSSTFAPCTTQSTS